MLQTQLAPIVSVKQSSLSRNKSEPSRTFWQEQDHGQVNGSLEVKGVVVESLVISLKC